MNHSRQIIISGLTLLALSLSSCVGSSAGTNNSIPTGAVQPDQTSTVASSFTRTPQGTPEASKAPTAASTIQSTAGSPTAQNTSQPASTQTQAPNTIPDFSHIFIIVMENHEASQIDGSRFAPYLNQLGHDYARAANYYAITHPSLPNYLALTGGDTFGISTDCNQCYVNADNIASQIEKAGKTWKAYMESMPGPCNTASASSYVVRHDPFIYYDNIRTNPASCKNVVPLTQFTKDLGANSLPDFVWITPNVCNDMHDCGVIAGDNWLKTWVPKILASQAWKDNGVLFITFDEGTTRKGCCSYAAGGNVYTLVISPLVTPGFVSNNPYDHYSLVKTIETAWNLPLLGKAASDSTPLMSEFFSKNP